MTATAPVAVVDVDAPDERSRICELVLRSLPGWFGLEEPIAQYVRDVAGLPTFAVHGDGEEPAGFLTLKQHTPWAAEVYVMGVRTELHRRGLGSALLERAERWARDAGVELLQVKTLGPSHPSRNYAATRTFYEARGFRPLEELHGLWSPGNPALIMVKPLKRAPSPQAVLWGLQKGAMATQALHVAARFEVADRLAGGAQRVGDIAAEAGADADALYRFLRALATVGVFTEEGPRVFANTAASELLRTDGAERWHEFALQFGDEWYRAFAEAARTVETGEPAFPAVFGRDYDDWLGENPSACARFSRSMEGGARERIRRVVELPWEDEVVVDVGGGTGAMLVELLCAHPRLRGVLFDLPEVAREARDRIESAGLAARCDVVGGSYLDGVPAGDAYVLSRILHGLGDERAGRVLRNVGAAARPGARLLILDAVLPEGNEAHENKWLDLLMLVLSGGRERTEAEWRALLSAAGFEPLRIEDGLIHAGRAPR